MVKDRAAKGEELEEAFAEWMTSSLGYTAVTRTHRGTGKAATRGYQVDIHGKVYSPWWRTLHVVGLCVWAVATAAFFLPDRMAGVQDTVETTVSSIVGSNAKIGRRASSEPTSTSSTATSAMSGRIEARPGSQHVS